MKDSIIIDMDLVFNYIHNVLKIESSRLPDNLFWEYFFHGAKCAEEFIRNMFPEDTYTDDEIEKKIHDQYFGNDSVIVDDDPFESYAECLGCAFVTLLFTQSIDLKVVLP